MARYISDEEEILSHSTFKQLYAQTTFPDTPYELGIDSLQRFAEKEGLYSPQLRLVRVETAEREKE